MSLCTSYRRDKKTLRMVCVLKGYCPSRKKGACTTGGNATWCALAMRGRV